MITRKYGSKFARHPYSLSLNSPLWRCLILELSTPFFLIKYAEFDAQSWLGETAIYGEVEALLHFSDAKSHTTHRQIEQIALITSSKRKHGGGWHIQNIKEIWAGETMESKHQVVKFVTNSGKSYFSGSINNEEADLKMVFPVSIPDISKSNE
ncbi:MAG TPA: hypothetical protein VIF82_05815 [Burkholderiaceae bacterium]|jgi:hypothetical protein